MIKKPFSKTIPKGVIAIAMILLGSMSLWSFYGYAQSEYPTTYESTTSENAVPPAPPVTVEEPAPPPCLPENPDYQDCIKNYLDTMKKNMSSGIEAQMPPSPYYSQKKTGADYCALGGDKCEDLDKLWREEWMTPASNMELDFETPIGHGVECKTDYDYFGLTYYYKCQTVQPTPTPTP